MIPLMSNPYCDFIEANKQLWSKFPNSDGSKGLLLVEPNRHPVISHSNAVFARIIKQARGLSIGWMDTGDPHIQQRLASYDPNSTVIYPSKLNFFEKLAFVFQFVCLSLRLMITKDIRGLSFAGIPLGDILYDSYLASYKLATVLSVDRKLLKTLKTLVKRYYITKKTLTACNASAVLVSHQVGLSSGILARVALKLGLAVYLRTAGNFKVALNMYNSISEIYNYPYIPRPVDMQALSCIDQEKLDYEFEGLMTGRNKGLGDEDVTRAYNKQKKTYYSKEQFASEFKVSHGKPFIFVTLHGFNDHPHSHLGEMLFRDYYDWFVQTLNFSKTETKVNWIFKEHPTAALYPTVDISVPDHFTDCPEHIIFLGADSSFNSKSLLYIADVVVTVCGTAGVEFAAAKAIPTVLAGKTLYSGFGFTIEPKTKIEYFDILNNIASIEKLTPQQQYIAKKCFLYIQQYSHVPFSFSPLLTLEETRDGNLDHYYWKHIVESYKKDSDVRLAEFEKYVQCVRREGFSRLNKLQIIEH
jgi:hypothetical protein